MSFCELKDKVALVTGAAQGIGLAIAMELAEAGADIAICDLNAEKLSAAQKQIEAKGVKCLTSLTNVTKADEVDMFIKTTVKELGGLHIVVNNAGITRDNLMIRLKDEDWDAVLNINLKGAFLVSQAAARPLMKNRWGRIINLSSVIGLMGNAGQANYAASKAGLIGLTKSMAKELASRGITVNAVAPGFIASAMTDVLTDEVKAGILDRVPLGELGTTEDVARTIRFLASNEARYITGQVLPIDGGLVM